MRIAMIGTGYVGLVSGTCFSEFGIHVTCVDKDQSKIDKLKKGIIPIFEPGLSDMVIKNQKAGRLDFTTDLKQAVQEADVIFIAVGTPSRRGEGHADLSYVFAAAEEIAESITSDKLVVTKSTVPVGTGEKIAAIFKTSCPKIKVDVASNPEFLREGSAIEDFMRPDRVVIGVSNEESKKLLSEVYRPLFLNETPIVFTDVVSAELTKYAANSFLATKIAFINEIANICEKCGANVQTVSKAIGLDKRIGSKFLNAGPGFGGSCFPKDLEALVYTAKELGAPSPIVESVEKSNKVRKAAMAPRIVETCGGDIKNKTIAVLGVTFKPNTDDMRDSPSLDIIPALQQSGATIKAYDPEGMQEANALLPKVSWCNSSYEAIENADALVIITEWNEFRSLNLEKVRELMTTPTIIDLRNIYKPDEMSGFNYYSIGRQNIPSNKKQVSIAS